MDKDFPQKIFEIGKIVLYDPKKETKSREENHLSLAISHSKANFTEALETLNYLLKNNKEVQIKPCENPSFISGRCAEIFFNKKVIGIIGEIHPKTLAKWKLRMPVVALEINLDDLSL